MTPDDMLRIWVFILLTVGICLCLFVVTARGAA